MTGALIDSSVLIDIARDDPTWGAWSRDALRQAGENEPLFINQIIFAETAIAFQGGAPEYLTAAGVIQRRDLPWSAAGPAGKAHADYRRRGGTRQAILADFLIGAHAQVENLTLITRDPRRIRAAFPEVRIVAPQSV
ncbi:MAG: type II toxin-antitoxin system VapC family toxin [Caulobacteraceae bacterium]